MSNTVNIASRLTPLTEGHTNRHGQRVRLYQCSCGNTKDMIENNVKYGLSKSCGCIHREQLIARNKSGEIPIQIKHGGRYTPEYEIFKAAKRRCTVSRDKQFHNYGGRGIEFRFSGFAEFIDDVGWRPDPSLSLDRINNDGHYEKGNLRWTTMQVQRLNQRPRRLCVGAGE